MSRLDRTKDFKKVTSEKSLMEQAASDRLMTALMGGITILTFLLFAYLF